MQASNLRIELEGAAGRWPIRVWALLDIREAGEAYAGHIPTATALPRRLLEYRIRMVAPDPSTRIVLYDAGSLPNGAPDRRAACAASTLAALGYNRVDILDGGLAAWREVGGSLATGANVPSKYFGERVLEEDAVPAIAPKALAEAMANDEAIAIRDVRTRDEFEHHRLPGAILAPGFDLAALLPSLSTGNDLVVVNCAGRTRSIIATATAMRLGFTNVRSLENGTMGWRLAGLEVETGPLPPSAAERHANDFPDEELAAKARVLGKSVGLAEFSTENLANRLTVDACRPVIVDLRSLAKYRDGHIANSLALPGGQAIQRTDEFLVAPGRHVVLCDSGDTNAHLAGYWLKRMGFPRVSVLAGGIDRWRDEGRALVMGRHTPPFIPDEAQLREAVTFVGPVSVARSRDDAGPSGERPLILDIRTSRDFRDGHVPGAIWAPRGWIEDAAEPWRQHPEPFILIGQDDNQALLAAGQLKAEGHSRISVLSGGMSAWRKASLPEEAGLGPACKQYLPDLVEPPYAGELEQMKAYLEWEVAPHAGTGDVVIISASTSRSIENNNCQERSI